MNGPEHWIGQNFGLWQAAEAEALALAQELQKSDRSMVEMQRYVQRMQAALDNIKTSHNHISEMFIDKAGAERGQTRLKEAALQELQRLDPANKLLDPRYRQALYDKEKEARITEIKSTYSPM